MLKTISGTEVILTKGLTKTYRIGNESIVVLKDINLQVFPGEFVSIMGPSGSGKSTLLNILGILDHHDTGEYWLNNTQITNLTETRAAQYRSQLIGFVFQSFNLLPFKTVLDNVALPLYYQNEARKEREKKAMAILERVGMLNRFRHLPTELSGGQRQRVAIARALVTNPPLILADEPTGNLDTTSTGDVLSFFVELNREGRTIVMITHNESHAVYTSRTIRLVDGLITHQGSV